MATDTPLSFFIAQTYQSNCIPATVSKITWPLNLTQVCVYCTVRVCTCVCSSSLNRPDQIDMIQFVFQASQCGIIRLTIRLSLNTRIAITNFSSHCLYSLRVLILCLQYVYIVKSFWISSLSVSLCLYLCASACIYAIEREREGPKAHKKDKQAKCLAQGHKILEWRDGLLNVSLVLAGETKKSI